MKTSIQLLEELEKSRGAYIDKIVWIMASLGTSTLYDMLEDVDQKRLKEILPLVAGTIIYHIEEREKDMVDVTLIENGKLGFLAEVLVPIRNRFIIADDGGISSSYSRGHCYVTHVYAESREELVEKIAETSEYYYNKDLEKFKNKQSEEKKNSEAKK